ncbi:MAG TPA: amidohydrolase family protein, partial [Nitrososphaerales archaeon]|nr:amidohydrolase family protein [Nitrososphaerales archaeon]
MRHDLVVEGRVVTPSGLVECEVGVSEGRIAEVRKQGLAGERRVKAGSSIVFPGFVDIHVHMREPGWEKKEDFRTGTRAAAHGGVTTVADMPNNPVPIVSLEEVERKRKLAKAKAVVGVELYGGVRPDRLDLIPRLSDGVRAFKVYMSS